MKDSKHFEKKTIRVFICSFLFLHFLYTVLLDKFGNENNCKIWQNKMKLPIQKKETVKLLHC